jgi:hypothetical protein
MMKAGKGGKIRTRKHMKKRGGGWHGQKKRRTGVVIRGQLSKLASATQNTNTQNNGHREQHHPHTLDAGS